MITAVSHIIYVSTTAILVDCQYGPEVFSKKDTFQHKNKTGKMGLDKILEHDEIRCSAKSSNFQKCFIVQMRYYCG